jgi:DNA-directed RNA polymerase specialized sigma24 family protein
VISYAADVTDARSSAAVGPSAAEPQILVEGHSEPIHTALDKLPSDEGQAIVTAQGNCSYREAAITLGESERTIKLRIRSGLRRLAGLNDALSVSQTLAVGDRS